MSRTWGSLKASRGFMEKLAIMGTSGLAGEMLDLVEDGGCFEVEFFIENWDRTKLERPFLGKPVVWLDDAGPTAATHKAICSLGTTRRVDFISQAADLGFEFATVVHPTARVSRRSSVGAGTLVSAGVIIAADTTLGEHVIVNRGVLIGHDTTVGDCVTISPGANIAGMVAIGDRCYIGMGAVVVDRIQIGPGSVVAAGAVVVRDVPAGVQVMGVPARVVKEDIDGR